MGRLFGTPFLDGDNWLAALVLGWLISFACRHDFGLTAIEKELGGFCQVLTYMETIGHLNGMGSRFGSC